MDGLHNVSAHGFTKFDTLAYYRGANTPPGTCCQQYTRGSGSCGASGHVIAKRRIQMSTDRPDFMTYILEHNDDNGITRNKIHANSGLLLVGGSETTASLLLGWLFYMSTHTRAYRKLADETRGAFPTQKAIALSATAELPYLDCVLQESLRLYPPIAGILPRKVPKGGAFINGQYVPQNVTVSMGYYSAFRAGSNFVDPETFIPERWLPESKDGEFSNDNREALQPFSYGPRSCLGRNLAYAEMRLIASKLLWNFDIILDKECGNWINQKTYNVWEKKPLMVKLTPVQR